MPIYKLRKAGKIGSVELEAGNYQEATNIFEQGLVDYEVSPEEEVFMVDYYKLMANAYKKIGNFEKAGYYFEKHLVTTDGESKMKNDVVKTSKQIALKKFKEELAQLEAEEEARTNYFIYLMLVASLVILLLLFFLLKFYKTKNKNEAKFEALLKKIKNSSEENSSIVDTKDEELEEKNITEVPEETKQQIIDGLKKLEKQEYYLKQDCNSYNVAKKIGTNTS
jgi:tetratricopeptide (TPR) repeat protein